LKVAFIKNNKIYDRMLLGLSLRERLKRTLERAGFDVRFFEDCLELNDAQAYLIILKPVLVIERELHLEGRKILVYNGSVFGYLFDKDFAEIYNGDLKYSIEKYVSLDSITEQEIWAVELSEENLKEAEKILLKSLVKSKRTGLKPAYYDGIIARTINRRVSLKISSFLSKRNVTPNQITVFSFFISVLGSTLFLLNNYFITAVAGIIIQLHSIIDGCDGEIARLKFMESKYGAWLDGVLDRYADFIIIFCITYALATSNSFYWIVGLLASFATFIIPYTGDKFVAAYKRTYTNPSKFSIPITRDVRLFTVFLGAIFNQLGISLILIALFGNLEGIRRIVALKNIE